MDKARLAHRNSILMIIEGTLFWAALAFLQGDTVVSKFMESNTGSIALAGLAASLRSVMFLLGQFIAGMFIHKIKVQRRFLAIVGFIDRPLMLVMPLLLLGGLNGPSAAWIFLFLYSTFFFVDGLLGLCWMELNTRTLPATRRGVVLSLNQTTSGIVGIFVGFGLRSILTGPLPMQYQYAIIFGCCGALMLIDAVMLALFKDIPHASDPDRPIPHIVDYVKQLLPLFTRNKSVRTLMITRMLYLLTMISAPINVLFGMSIGGLTEVQQASLVFMPVIGQVISGVIWAQASRKLTFPIMMFMAESIGALTAILNIITFFMARAGIPIMVPLSFTMILISVNTTGYIGFTQHMISMVDDAERPRYLVMSAIVLAPFAFGTYFAGLIVEHWGYMPVYLIMLFSGLVGASIVYRYFLSNRTA